ncbi:high mobility group box-domain-containing protein [Chaetomium strumarium]|uniref:High mobility group box-domain-containing protein n=1 Tax=Chaetomium strumarium TaxID=1170767 RepID=A0AAJ0H435_9PEZI|nr:high mobility group box-domain-containing protein [Chaetomium strumarium]
MASHGGPVKPSPLAFLFSGNEMIIQCTATTQDQSTCIKILEPVMNMYRNINDGKCCAIVRRRGTTQYWIVSVTYAETLDKNVFDMLKRNVDPIINQDPIPYEPVNASGVTKIHIRRPRNQFIIYRQWMSAKLHARDPSIPAAIISQIVAQMWRTEKPQIRAHFRALAIEEDRLHKARYPGYRYQGGTRHTTPARQGEDDPMTIGQRLIAAGH